ncbi:UNKNOWN [Stylonychia lemnae]|uniref:Uncharacterized protein n=1 Tax=Stylonychia lemnae TaxID=5949 RepID=A0A077ZRP6_STYLE|nr:UNKNOWN [Stylonychia lemnae]|eukprot:CDW72139.1 UNKNOWN [Stylonychia lemnae]
MDQAVQPQNEQKKRKHLILYILDIPYFLIVFLLYKVIASTFYLPLFLALNFVQSFVFIKIDKCSLKSHMLYAVPRFVFFIIQAVLYIFYSMIPLILIQRYNILENFVGIEPDSYWVKGLNYGSAYMLLDVLQFATLRRFSKSLLFGMALKPQPQQRKAFVNSVMWILALIFTILSAFSYYGYVKLTTEYQEKIQQNPQDSIKCKVFFTHAFNCMVMGQVQLLLKILELILYVVVMFFKFIMVIFPWRKTILDEKLKDVAILTPYRIKYMRRDYNEKPADQWRGQIVIYLGRCFTDIPYFCMLLAIILSVFMARRLYLELELRIYNEQKELGDLLKEEILKHFKKLMKFYFKVTCLSVLTVYNLVSVLFCLTRIKRSLRYYKSTVEEIRKDFIDEDLPDQMKAIELVGRMIFVNQEKFSIDYSHFFIRKMMMRILIWRRDIYDQELEKGIHSQHNYTLDQKENEGKDQLQIIRQQGLNSIIELFFLTLCIPVCILQPYKIRCLYQDLSLNHPDKWVSLIKIYLKGLITDLPYIMMLISLIPSVFFAYKLKRSIDEKYAYIKIITISRTKDGKTKESLKGKILPSKLVTYLEIQSTIQQIQTLEAREKGLSDKSIAKLIRTAIQLKIMNSEPIYFCLFQAFLDLKTLPILLATSLNPFNWIFIKSLFKKEFDYANTTNLQSQEEYRRTVIHMILRKTIKDIWTYLILLPINLLFLYYIGLFRHLLKNKEKVFKQKEFDADIFKKKLSADQYQAISFFDNIQQLYFDYMYPSDNRYAVRIINNQFKKTIWYLPIIVLTLPLNPYRTYEFFILNPKNEFINFTFNNIKELNQLENFKRKSIVRQFKQSLSDFIAFVFMILILITGVRALYLIVILSVNGHLTRFNPFIRRITKSPLIIIKLLQIETKLANKSEEFNQNEQYLSIKECIWLSLIELVMDLLVLPFIIAHFIFIPWRYKEIFNLAVSQFERIPTQRVKKVQYMREIENGKVPKRVQVVGQLIMYIAIDYLTVFLSIILVVTGWRAVNTIEFWFNHFRYRFSKNHEVKQFMETIIKDKSLVGQILNEFKQLLIDSFFFTLTLLVIIQVRRVKSLKLRLQDIYEKKKVRKEIQTLNYLARVKQFSQSLKKQNQDIDNNQIDKKIEVKKTINDLSKNVMSVLLPFLPHNEILKLEQTSKKMLIMGHHWPVWKNIYQEQHTKNQLIPELHKYMNFVEQENNDYRSACKRSFIYLKNNVAPEIPSELLDYTKGSQIVIVEELVYSLHEISRIYQYPIKFMDNFMSQATNKAIDFYDTKLNNLINKPKETVLQYLLWINYPPTVPIDQYEQELQEIWQYDYVRVFVNAIKLYALAKNVIIHLQFKAMNWIMNKLAAGPPLTNQNQHIIHTLEYSLPIAVPLYLLQFILIIPAILLKYHPKLISFYLIIQKFLFHNPAWYFSELFIILFINLSAEFQLEYQDNFKCQYYIKPFRILTLIRKFVKYLWRVVTGQVQKAGTWSWDKIKLLGVQLKKLALKLIDPLIRAGKGAAYYLGLLIDIIQRGIKFFIMKLSTAANYVAYWLYTIIKGILVYIWKGMLLIFEYLIKMPIQKTDNIYFWTFEFLLKYLKKFGIVGELIFTIFGLIWLLWPLVFGYLQGQPQYYIPAVILTIILIVRGRKIVYQNN